jgi:hypothetical protein
VIRTPNNNVREISEHYCCPGRITNPLLKSADYKSALAGVREISEHNCCPGRITDPFLKSADNKSARAGL